MKLCKDVPAEALAAVSMEPAKRNDKQKKLVGDHRDKLPTLTRAVGFGRTSAVSSTTGRQQLAAVQAEYPAPLPQGYIWYEEGSHGRASSHVFDRGDPRSPAAK